MRSAAVCTVDKRFSKIRANAEAMSSAEARIWAVVGYARDFKRGVIEMASQGSDVLVAMASDVERRIKTTQL